MSDNNVPMLRFREFSGAWEEKVLGNICQIYDGTHQTPKYVESGIPFYSVEHITSDNFNTQKFITKEVYEKEIKRVKLERGDVLMTRIGSVGVPKYIDWDIKASFYVSLALFKSESEELDMLCLNYIIQSTTLQREIWRRTIHVAYPKKINLGELSKCRLPLPSLPEQKKIASFLTAIDDRIGQLRREKELLEQYKKGVMQKIFSQEIRFRADDGTAFGAWEECFAKDIFKSHSNKKHDGNLTILAATQDKGMIPRDETGLKIQSSDSSVKSYKIVEKGDFVISLRSFQGGIEYSNFYGICSPAYIILKPIRDICDLFYKNYFKKERFIERLSKTVVGIRDGKQISYDAFGGLKIPFPSLPEQQKIASFLSALDTQIETVAGEVERMETFKKGLLQKMFV